MEGLFIIEEGEDEAAFGAELAIDLGVGVDEEGEATASSDFATDLDGVTRTDRVFETDLVEACVERCAARELIHNQGAAALTHDFTKDNARDNGIAREMTLNKEFLACNVVMSNCSVTVKGHVINEKHRFAMRKIFFYFVSFHYI